ncbi:MULTISPECIES: hypothetical protein [unclassified Desulfovibrio]|uniref:hypothetical protein n=1 Tax=unclassified Desulfovibrio TaxID=2593640 RepID=UPI002FDA8D88
MQGYYEIITGHDLAQAEKLLAEAGLRLPDGHTYGLGFYEDGRMAACGFLAGDILCGICVAAHAREGGLSTAILSRLVLHGRQEGVRHFFIFTKASEAPKFEASGFDLVGKSQDAALLEMGRPCYADWLAAVQNVIAGHNWNEGRQSGQNTQPPRTTDASGACAAAFHLGAIVMNANPFTLGHDYLARTAASACERLLVFVVEEERSVFPFAVRLALVQKGLADVGNILVLPAGPYMVSRASFPAYFTADARVGTVHAILDSTIFATRIARDLGIEARFAGSEPFDPVTAAYNDAMRDVFQEHGIMFREIPRLEKNHTAVSASRVRALLGQTASPAPWPELAGLLPQATLDFLRSEQGAALEEKLKNHTGRH